MTLLQILRPAVVTGVTPNGWLTRRPGDITIYAAHDGASMNVRYSAEVAAQLAGMPRSVLYPHPEHGPFLVSELQAWILRRYETRESR